MMKITLKPFLLIATFAASAFAANVDIKSKDFSGQEPLVVTAEIPMTPEFGEKILASKPEALQSGYIYLRKKLDAHNYAWYKAKPKAEAFRKLNAFRPNGAPPDSFVYTKFFGTRIAKAFQDESEIFFDKNFIYSARVPTLFYDEKKQWIELRSQTVGLGTMEIKSTPSATVFIDGDSIGQTPLIQAGVTAGIHTVKLSAKQYLPIVSGVMVSEGQITRKGLVLTPLETAEFLLPMPVSMDTLLDANTLIELEPFWDRLQYNKQQYEIFLSQQRQRFEQLYPKLMPSPAGLAVGDIGYARYKDSYQQTKDEAYGFFLASVVSGGKELEQALSVAQPKKDSLELLNLDQRVILDTAIVSRKGKVVEIQFKLSSADKRIDVGWVGTWSDTLAPSDSLLKSLKDTLGWSFLQVQFQNHPVKLTVGTNLVRRNYRYAQLSVVNAEKAVKLVGKFVLPEYILQQTEVQAWLNRDKLPKDSSKAVKAPVDEREAWLTAFRGDIVEIDGGTFRYKGKSVLLSPYAIQKTEVTQEHYQRIMLENPATRKDGKFVGAKKPVHNVNWDSAQAFCTAIGGSLPTEAQWEFAARAGGNISQIWKAGSVDQLPSSHAIFWNNSGALPNTDPGYGPQKVASKEPNSLGLYDMHGNVAEWMKDYDSWFHFFVDTKDPQGAWTGTDHVFKGGSWLTPLKSLDLTEKDYEDPRYWGPTMGLRCAFPSMQEMKLDSVKMILKAKDSLAKAAGITLLGGPIKVVVETIAAQKAAVAKPAPVSAPTPAVDAKPIDAVITAPAPVAPAAKQDPNVDSGVTGVNSKVTGSNSEVTGTTGANTIPSGEQPVVAPATPVAPAATTTPTEPVAAPESTPAPVSAPAPEVAP